MSEMIELVARAYEAERQRWTQKFENIEGEIYVSGGRKDDNGVFVEMVSPLSFHEFERLKGWEPIDRLRDHACARAAILAMRKPTEGMKRAGYLAARDDEPIYAAMIDEALK